jgi:hypothetical protein
LVVQGAPPGEVAAKLDAVLRFDRCDASHATTSVIS